MIVVWAQDNCFDEKRHEKFQKFVFYFVQEIEKLVSQSYSVSDEEAELIQNSTEVQFNMCTSDSTKWLKDIKQQNNKFVYYIFITLDNCSKVIPNELIDVIKYSNLLQKNVCVATFDYYDVINVFENVEKFWISESVQVFWNHFVEAFGTDTSKLYQKEVLENLNFLAEKLK